MSWYPVLRQEINSNVSAGSAWWQVIGDACEVDELTCEHGKLFDIRSVGDETERGSHGAPRWKTDRPSIVLQDHTLCKLAAHECFA